MNLLKSVFNFLFVAGVFVFAAPLARATECAGNWTIHSNGSTFRLSLTDTGGSEFAGTLSAMDPSEPVNAVYGTCANRRISFKRVLSSGLQVYQGWLFEKGSSEMAGMFSQDGLWQFGWYAVRSD